MFRIRNTNGTEELSGKTGSDLENDSNARPFGEVMSAKRLRGERQNESTDPSSVASRHLSSGQPLGP